MAWKLSAADELPVSSPPQQCAVKLIKLLQNSLCTWANDVETAWGITRSAGDPVISRVLLGSVTTGKPKLWDRVLNRDAENRSAARNQGRKTHFWRAFLRNITGKDMFKEVTYTSLRTEMLQGRTGCLLFWTRVNDSFKETITTLWVCVWWAKREEFASQNQ